ncbi:hypothetical protein KHC33_00305 [Methanospirillum sp. J.3.6.1-F.2.7.3]|uniref:Uncharacterized protein n=1 Tax=Methanospirillum purgamenti TaxID=2834276 RepID=A0A8E7B199_9EURY|nr:MULTISPECIES: hypothetical protein [Methanospirillum]MDX8549637.1 hypothetical protein [Methanospirillum hungatei]QVV89019.1 hypothetical protein KHC33_00305 [Methanospirillum sp. J.3.6.1-F.2.7.3]
MIYHNYSRRILKDSLSERLDYYGPIDTCADCGLPIMKRAIFGVRCTCRDHKVTA